MSALKAVILLICISVFASCTNAWDETATKYFASRKPFHMKRQMSDQQFFIRAKERIKSHTKMTSKRLIGPDGSLSNKDNKQFFAYDATLTFDTVNLDMHPDVLDIGCSKDRLYLKVRKTRHTNTHIKIGSLLVSSMDDFDCEIGQPTNEPVLYRLAENIHEVKTENGEILYVVDTKTIEFNQVFTHIKLQTHNPSVKQPESSSVTQTTPNKRWSVNRSFDIVNFNWDRDRKTARNPSIENQEGNFKYVCSNCYFYSTVRFTMEINFRWCKPNRAAASVHFDNALNANLTMTAEFEKTKDFTILKKKKITSIKFTILAIPVVVNVNFALEGQLQVQAKIQFNVAASFSREGQFGFNYDKRRGHFNWIKSFKGQD
ncbi:predicted protein [Naegleria gruberi]|uniref:Predicted protein n=1 Tax=Naegleria gruberi TaxID=5762 RepID=D2W596_NAEGR|nr:uncharacterized protein NAEGRDRAFT_54764 [Naegleria gruberi]EFC35756.1 predicted protein [Naegleria gruberi]|eukprot:XP_002668500.1 predicted protein [Naegleria gruberi strain NEG-M]